MECEPLVEQARGHRLQRSDEDEDGAEPEGPGQPLLSEERLDERRAEPGGRQKDDAERGGHEEDGVAGLIDTLAPADEGVAQAEPLEQREAVNHDEDGGELAEVRRREHAAQNQEGQVARGTDEGHRARYPEEALCDGAFHELAW